MSSGILIDSCLFIEHMRIKNKTNTALANVLRLGSDLFIAATAVVNELPLATLNRKHFESVDGLKLLLPVS